VCRIELFEMLGVLVVEMVNNCQKIQLDCLPTSLEESPNVAIWDRRFVCRNILHNGQNLFLSELFL